MLQTIGRWFWEKFLQAKLEMIIAKRFSRQLSETCQGFYLCCRQTLDCRKAFKQSNGCSNKNFPKIAIHRKLLQKFSGCQFVIGKTQDRKKHSKLTNNVYHKFTGRLACKKFLTTSKHFFWQETWELEGDVRQVEGVPSNISWWLCPSPPPFSHQSQFAISHPKYTKTAFVIRKRIFQSKKHLDVILKKTDCFPSKIFG